MLWTRRRIWIHRFYDALRLHLRGGSREKYSLERAAETLLDLIELVRNKTGAPRVFLVAHSMGGLICRSPDREGDPRKTGRDGDTDYVDRLFTYATPHGGIEFDIGFGLFEKVRDVLGVNGADIFGPERMWSYLNPGDPARSREVGPRESARGSIPERPDLHPDWHQPEDYDVAHEDCPPRSVGAKSDGLVQIENVYVPWARFAFVHRSHSGATGS